MLIEEWRIHSRIFGNNTFSYFPLIMTVFSFIASMMLPLYGIFLSRTQMVQLMHIIYLFFGASIGTFGISGREALNRRLGDVSLISYLSRTLPISDKRLFINFVLKDTLFYIIFLVAPFLLGYTSARWVLGLGNATTLYFGLSISATFLWGLSIMFLASTIYSHVGKKIFPIVFLGVFALILAYPQYASLEGLAFVTPAMQF